MWYNVKFADTQYLNITCFCFNKVPSVIGEIMANVIIAYLSLFVRGLYIRSINIVKRKYINKGNGNYIKGRLCL